MSGDGSLKRLYADLEPAEQARLVITQLARDDEPEALRIAAAVPRSESEAAVRSYNAVLAAAETLRTAAIAVATTTARSLAIAEALLEVGRFQAASLGEVAASEVYKVARAGKVDDDRIEAILNEAHEAAIEESELLLTRIEAWRDEERRELAAFWQAFDECCRERLGMDPETVERAFLPEPMRRPDAINEVEPDLDEVATSMAALTGASAAD